MAKQVIFVESLKMVSVSQVNHFRVGSYDMYFLQRPRNSALATSNTSHSIQNFNYLLHAISGTAPQYLSDLLQPYLQQDNYDLHLTHQPLSPPV